MDEKNNSEKFPDISGVFDIDEKDIPDEIMAPVSEKVSGTKDYEPILLNDPEQLKITKAELKKQKAEKKAEKKAAKRKKAKKRFIIAVSFIAVVLLAVFGIKTAVERAKRPTGEIAEATLGNISKSYAADVVLTSSVVGQGSVKTVAVFSENDYDIYSISKGLPAVVTLENGTSVNGTVTDIEQEKTGDSLIEKIRAAFPEGEYSSGVNYVITVETEMTEALPEDGTGKIIITTANADDAVLVPSGAVHKDGTQYYVWIYKSLKRTAVKQEVEIGIENAGMTQITKGLEEGTKIVSAFDCEDGELTDILKIKVKK